MWGQNSTPLETTNAVEDDDVARAEVDNASVVDYLVEGLAN